MLSYTECLFLHALLLSLVNALTIINRPKVI